MLENGYIKLHRSMSSWRWYKEPKTVLLWVHLLLNANYEPRALADRMIERGQLAVSLAGLSEQTGLTVKEIRLGLDRLKKTGEISVWSNRHMSVITINEYDQYQSDTGTQKANQGQTEDKPMANQGQTEGRQRATMKEREESKESKKDKNIGRRRAPFVKPSIAEIEAYVLENGLAVDVQRFYDHYEANGWMVGKNRMQNWQATVRNWARRDIPLAKAPKPGTPPDPPKQLAAWEQEWLERVKKASAERKAAGDG